MKIKKERIKSTRDMTLAELIVAKRETARRIRAAKVYKYMKKGKARKEMKDYVDSLKNLFS